MTSFHEQEDNPYMPGNYPLSEMKETVKIKVYMRMTEMKIQTKKTKTMIKTKMEIKSKNLKTTNQRTKIKIIIKTLTVIRMEITEEMRKIRTNRKLNQRSLTLKSLEHYALLL